MRLFVGMRMMIRTYMYVCAIVDCVDCVVDVPSPEIIVITNSMYAGICRSLVGNRQWLF